MTMISNVSKRIVSLALGKTAHAPLFTASFPAQLPMKPGTPIPGLDIFKEKEAPVALERSEYPEWVSSLTQREISLAQLRRMSEEVASDQEKKRYLKLTRRMLIKKNNEEMAK